MRFVALLLLALLVSPLGAQDAESYAFIIYAEGFDVTIFRNEELLTYDVLRDDVIGMPLLPGDLIQTDPDTFVELQVMPSRTVIKVAENTTFRIEEIGGAGGGSFDLAYGRLRARVDRVTGNDRFQIRGRNAVAGVRGTDFGYDFLATREGDSEAETQVYVFEGSVEVTEPAEEEREPSAEEESEASPRGAEEGAVEERAAPRTILLSANEMVSVIRRTVQETLEERERQEAIQEASFEPRRIETEINQFWQEKDFQEEPVAPEEVEERFPEIQKKVAELSTERRAFLLAKKRSALGEEVEPEREPVLRRLAVPPLEERLRRSITPDMPGDRRLNARRGGAILTATGTLIGAAAVGMAYQGDEVISGYETGFDNPVTAATLLSGGIFVSGGLISFILSLFP